MSTILCFSNPGEIDPLLITTMGLHVKEHPNPIGHFGTGLKYAIAVTLRLGGKITILSGLTQITFNTKVSSVRGKDFTFIQMSYSGFTQNLSFTTELGKNWLPWMAYREFYCNALDEKGDVSLLFAPPKAKFGFTQILIECEALLAVATGPKSFLLPPAAKPIWASSFLEIYLGESFAGFYHGIKVLDYTVPTSFTYNLLDQVSLTEDRTIPSHLFNNIVACEIWNKDRPPIDPAILNKIITAGPTHAEHNFYFPDYYEPRPEIISAKNPSPAITRARASFLPKAEPAFSLYDELKGKAPPKPDYSCEHIDFVLNALQNVQKDLRRLETGLSRAAVGEIDAAKTCSAIDKALADLFPSMEEIRNINDQLRTYANYWRVSCKEQTQDLPARKAASAP